MPAADLAAADGLAAALGWLQRHPRVTAFFAGVGAENLPPYPLLRVRPTTSGGGRNLRWLLAPELTLESLGDLDGTPGSAALRRGLFIAVAALTELPAAPAQPGQPVVTHVEDAGGGGESPLPTGQPRWVMTVRLYVHPPNG